MDNIGYDNSNAMTMENMGETNVISGTNFQPNLSKSNFVNPGDVKITSIYESDYADKKFESPYDYSNKNDIIPKQELTSKRVNNRSNKSRISMNRPIIKESQSVAIAGGAEIDDYDIDGEPLPVGRWLITIIALCIPVVNVLMLLVWAFSKGNKARKNFCKALLIVVVLFASTAGALFYLIGVTDVPNFVNDFMNEYDVKGIIEKYI